MCLCPHHITETAIVKIPTHLCLGRKGPTTSLHHDNSICRVGASSLVETSPLKPAPPPSAQPCHLSSWRTLCHTTVPYGTLSRPEPFSFLSTLSLGQHLHASGLNAAHKLSPPGHTFRQAPHEYIQSALTSHVDVTHVPKCPEQRHHFFLTLSCPLPPGSVNGTILAMVFTPGLVESYLVLPFPHVQ